MDTDNPHSHIRCPIDYGYSSRVSAFFRLANSGITTDYVDSIHIYFYIYPQVLRRYNSRPNLLAKDFRLLSSTFPPRNIRHCMANIILYNVVGLANYPKSN